MAGERIQCHDRTGVFLMIARIPARLRAILVLALALLLSACEGGPLAPITSTIVEIRGPEYAYVSKSPNPLDPTPFICTVTLSAKAVNALSGQEGGMVEWAGGYILVRDGDREVRRITLSHDDLRWGWGYLRPGGSASTRTFRIDAPVPNFRWQLVAAYYDVQTGHTRDARFQSRCSEQ
jgi:hypothetical protein